MAAPFYEKGVYRCEVVSQAMGEASTGTPQFVLRFKVQARILGDEEEAVTEYERTCFRSITEKTIPYFLEDLKTLGFEGGSFKDLDPNTPGYHSFRGAVIDMICNHENDQKGEPRERWSIRQAGGSIEVKPLEPAKYRQLDNLFGKALKDACGRKANGKPAAAAPARAAASEPPPTPPYAGSDDDIPF